MRETIWKAIEPLRKIPSSLTRAEAAIHRARSRVDHGEPAVDGIKMYLGEAIAELQAARERISSAERAAEPQHVKDERHEKMITGNWENA